MNYASGWQRALAWCIDFIILATVLLVTSRLIWALLPETYIEEPFRAMQLYSKREVDSFFYTFIVFTCFVAAYQILLPLSSWGGTAGHRLANIKVVQPNGDSLRAWSSVRRFCITVLKCSLVFFVGPTIALLGGNVSLSVLFLAAPVVLFLVSFLVAIQRPEGAWLWEHLGGYRFVRRR